LRIDFKGLVHLVHGGGDRFRSHYDFSKCQTFEINSQEITTLEEYLGEYFSRILKKLKELNYDREKASKKKLPF
jgi:hypothetical protein